MAKQPFFEQEVYLVDVGDDCDEIAGYEVHDLSTGDGLEPLQDGEYVAVYKLVHVKRYRTEPRLE